MAAVPIVYTLRTWPTCEALRVAWKEQGIEFEERMVDSNQAYMDEARLYGEAVPIIVYPDGKVEEGFDGEWGWGNGQRCRTVTVPPTSCTIWAPPTNPLSSLCLGGTMAAVPIVYTLRTWPTCEALRVAWKEQGIEFEERMVDSNQAYMDEARLYGEAVPIIVFPDGKVEEGFEGEWGWGIF